jgi:hypothetical protein
VVTGRSFGPPKVSVLGEGEWRPVEQSAPVHLWSISSLGDGAWVAAEEPESATEPEPEPEPEPDPEPEPAATCPSAGELECG